MSTSLIAHFSSLEDPRIERNCLEPYDYKRYQFGKLHHARMVLESLMTGKGLVYENS